ncbi:MAG: YcaO-like family protein [Candidatus Competibacteraceae bacterium]|nr:YcaO-like family protein [Candidatus Competibacteraceae bacterium]
MNNKTASPPSGPAIGPSADELAAALNLYENALPPGTRFRFDISALDILGMPVIVDALILEDGTWVDGFGYGASLEEARVGALGELSEVAHLTRAIAADPGVTASFSEMVVREGADRVIDPRCLALPAGTVWKSSDPMHWLQVRRWPEGTAWVPREFVAHTHEVYASGITGPLIPPCVTPITNGNGAGVTLEQALAHGVLELLQRDGNTTRFRAMDPGIVIALDEVVDPGIKALLARLRAKGIEPLAKLAATEFGTPSVYVVDNGTAQPGFPLQITACGEAAHPNAERALRKALLEFMAARCRKTMMHGPLDPIRSFAGDAYINAVHEYANPAAQEPRTLEAMLEWMSLPVDVLRARLQDRVLSQTRTVALHDLPSVPDADVRDPVRRLHDLSARLSDAGHEIFFYDATPATGGPIVIKAIVSGLECETMSYHRIGLRGVQRLMLEPPPGGGGVLAGIGTPPQGAKPVLLTPAHEERLGGVPWLDTDRIDAIVGALYPLYREPASHTVQLRLQQNRTQGRA